MKRTIIFAGLAFMATLSSCNKIDLPVENGLKPINIDITVSGLMANQETKAVKSGWIDGDKLNLWFDNNTQQLPDMVIKYNAAQEKWELDGTATVSGNVPSTSGQLNAIYCDGLSDMNYSTFSFYGPTVSEFSFQDYSSTIGSYYPSYTKLFAYSSYVSMFPNPILSQYTYQDGIFKASIDNWQFANNTQIVITGLPTGTWALSCDKMSVRNRIALFHSGGPSGSAFIGETYVNPRGSYVMGTDNADGKAFYLDYSSISGPTEDFYLTLYNTEDSKSYTFTAASKELHNRNGDQFGFNAVKIAFSKFTLN